MHYPCSDIDVFCFTNKNSSLFEKDVSTYAVFSRYRIKLFVLIKEHSIIGTYAHR